MTSNERHTCQYRHLYLLLFSGGWRQRSGPNRNSCWLPVHSSVSGRASRGVQLPVGQSSVQPSSIRTSWQWFSDLYWMWPCAVIIEHSILLISFLSVCNWTIIACGASECVVLRTFLFPYVQYVGIILFDAGILGSFTYHTYVHTYMSVAQVLRNSMLYLGRLANCWDKLVLIHKNYILLW